jgi:hypothetical protein
MNAKARFVFFSLIVSSLITLQTGCMQTPVDAKPVASASAATHQETASERTADSLIGNF